MASMCTHPYMAAHLSCPTGSSSLRWVLTSFVLPVHNQGASLAIHQGHALRRKFLPATSSFFVLSSLIQTLRLQHLSVDACYSYTFYFKQLIRIPDLLAQFFDQVIDPFKAFCLEFIILYQILYLHPCFCKACF